MELTPLDILYMLMAVLGLGAVLTAMAVTALTVKASRFKTIAMPILFVVGLAVSVAGGVLYQL